MNSWADVVYSAVVATAVVIALAGWPKIWPDKVVTVAKANPSTRFWAMWHLEQQCDFGTTSVTVGSNDRDEFRTAMTEAEKYIDGILAGDGDWVIKKREMSL